MPYYRPPCEGPLFQFLGKKATFAKPQPLTLTKTLLYGICPHPHSDLEARKLLYYLPPCRVQCFTFLQVTLFLKKPNQQLSRERYYKSFAHTKPAMWRLKKWSIIRPLAAANYYSFYQRRHFCKAPTSSSHQNFMLGYLCPPGL